MDKQHFAKSFGLHDYEELLDNSQLIFQDKGARWYISKLPHGKYLTWEDTEIADDRVEVFYSKEDAENYIEELRKRKMP